jgi:glyoxylase-like metal-dependent hydrolase (beta-lactamase superfamily II)
LTQLEPLGEGLWRWALRHPEWHPSTEFGSEVACWALRHADRTVVIDPLLPEDDGGELAEELDSILEGEVAIVVTIPYHVRSAEPLALRWSATVYGHRDVARRFDSGDVRFQAIDPGEAFAGGLTGHRIGSPPRKELPLHVPGRAALVFGDALVGAEGGLRVWQQRPRDEKRERWYRERLVPSLEPLLELDVDRVLTTHGPPVLEGGGAALRDALSAPPWYHRPS